MTDLVPAVEVEDLAVSYGAVIALDGVSLSVRPGTVFGLLGPNGAGKTTLVRVLSTLLRPGRGRARVLGRDVVREPLAVRLAIGLAGQSAAVDQELTGRENWRWSGSSTACRRAEARRRAAEILERFGADRRREPAGRAPTRAGCAAASTWRPA